MAFIKEDGEAVKPQKDFNLCVITDVVEKVSAKGNANMFFVYEKQIKDETKELSKVFWLKMMHDGSQFYDAVVDSLGLDPEADLSKDSFVQQEVCISERIDPENPTYTDNNGYEKPNYELWDVYSPESGPNRSEQDYQALCEQFGFTPKGKAAPAAANPPAESQPGFPKDAPATGPAPDDLPF